MSRLVFLGPGRVGTTLAKAFAAGNHEILGAIARDKQSTNARTFASLLKRPVHSLDDSSVRKIINLADVIFITTPDRIIHEMIAFLCAEMTCPEHPQVVVHTSGALTSQVCHPLQEHHNNWIHCGSLHPLQTFGPPEIRPANLHGVYFAVEGDDVALPILCQLVEQLGGHPNVISSADKARYHAAAVLASNALVALAQTAVDLLPQGAHLDALLPILQGAVDNLRRLGLPKSLTGPVERNDIPTLVMHLRALQSNPTALSVYLSLSRVACTIAYDKGSLTQEERDRILQLFDIDTTAQLANLSNPIEKA